MHAGIARKKGGGKVPTAFSIESWYRATTLP